MRVLYLIDNFSLGGAQTVVKGLMENGAEESKKYAISLRLKNPEMTIGHPHAISYQSRSKYSFKVLKYLKVFILEKKIEILHCQLPRSIVMGYLLKRTFPGIKYIIHEQGDVFESRAYSILLRVMKKKADGILVCSKATGEMLKIRSRIEPQKIFTLYNFVDLTRFNPGNRSPFKGHKIAFAGRIEKRKGWREFVKAAHHFHGREGLTFHIAGTGTEATKLVRRIRKQKDARIEYVGFIGQMKEFYQQADLMVIPSHFEPMGMVAIEAMACGVPVLATNVPGLNEIVRNKVNGWTYPSKSVPDLTRAIESILNCNPEVIETIIKRGIRHSSEFSLQKYSRKLQEYYASIK